MSCKCKVCGKEFESDGSLHKHLKAHKLRMVEYYQKYYPRYDLHDNKIIKFKNKQQYFETDFNTRTNLRLWLKERSEKEAKEYCKDILKKRKERRELTYAPTEVELRTLMFPPTSYFNKLFGNYYELCDELGFQNKYVLFPNEEEFVNTSNPIFETGEALISVDTREQKPLKFFLETELKTLPFGDYAFEHPQIPCNTYIERKSIGDFIGTLSGGFPRFKKEIEKSVGAGANLIILIEETLDRCRKFNYQPHVSKKIRATPEYIFHNTRELIQNYPTIQFLFVKGRVEAARVIQKIFVSNIKYIDYDLQLAYNMGLL